MSMQLLLYFGTLTFIGIGALVLFIVISIRSDQKESQKHSKRQKTTISGAYRMQVILPDAGKPLIWLANGFAYHHPNEMEDSDDISALTEFLAKLQEASPNTTISLPKQPFKQTGPAISKVQEAKISQARAEEEEEEEEETAIAETKGSPPASAPLANQTAKDNNPIEPEKLPVSSALSYEEQMALPFLERLRASFFGERTAPTPRSSAFQPSPVARIPKLEELEDIVHKQLDNIPDAPLISIRTAHNGLLEIVVNHQSYERIDDIPDDTIRQTMHKSVKIWESRM